MTEEGLDKVEDSLETLMRLTKQFFEDQLPHFHLDAEQEFLVRVRMTEGMRFWR
jgi:hypothetical protein